MNFFNAEDLFGYIANELNYSKKDLIRVLGTSSAIVSKWENHETIPSQEMYRKMLYFAKIMGVDCSEFTIKLYIESVLTYIYEDKYLLCFIDEQTNRAKIQRISDNESLWIDIESLTNKEINFFG